MQFRNEKLFVKVSITVRLSPGPPKMNRRHQLRLHSLLNKFDQKTVSDFCQVRLFFCYKQLKLEIANH